MPDKEFGERPVAFVQMVGEAKSGDLAGKLEETLPRFKVPNAFYEWPEGADSGGMKPDRRFFRDLASRMHQ